MPRITAGIDLRSRAERTLTASEEAQKAIIQQAQTYMRANIRKLDIAIINGRVKSWADWATYDVPALAHLPYTADNIKEAKQEAVKNAAVQNRAALELAKSANEEAGRVSYRSRDIALKGFKLRTRQKKAYNHFMTSVFEKQEVNCNLLPLPPGQGKSVICAAIMVDVLNKNRNTDYFGIPWASTGGRIIYLTPAPVVEKTKRTLIKAGIDPNLIGGLTHPISLISFEELSTIDGRKWFTEYTTTEFENQVTRYRWKNIPPDLVIVDESHKFKKPHVKKSKYLAAFLDFPSTKWLFTTATPAHDAENCWLYLSTSGIKWKGKPISVTHVREIISTVIGPDESIKKTGNAGMEALKDFMKPIINLPPADPATSIARNELVFIPLPTENKTLLAVYQQAMQRWFEAKERAQEEPSALGEQMAQFTILTQAAELMTVPHWTNEAIKAINAGQAYVCGLKYQEPLRQLCLALIKAGEEGKINIPGFGRDHISVIFGGKKVIFEKDVYKPSEWATMRTRLMQWEALPEDQKETSPLKLTAKEKTKLKNTAQYYVDSLKLDKTTEEFDEQGELILKYRLNKQSKSQRQEEIDRFQDGRTVVCLFTLASGGTGLDLDKQEPHVRDRVMDATICFYAEEFGQAFGRCVRIATLQPIVHQRMTFFAGTIMANHVAPVLSRKLKNLAKFSMSGDDLADMLAVKTTLKDLQEDAAMKGTCAARQTTITVDDESGFTGDDEFSFGSDDDDDDDND